MKITALLITWNGTVYLHDCLRSLLMQSLHPDICIVDNHSTDDSLDIIRSFSMKFQREGSAYEILENQENIGFPAAANAGISHLLDRDEAPEVVLLLNQDTVLDQQLVARVVEVFTTHERAGVVGCRCLYPDQATIQHDGGYLAYPRLTGEHYFHHEDVKSAVNDQLRPIEYVSGSAMALRTKSLREVGLFDEVFSPGYYEDVDLCLRMSDQAWDVLHCPQARLVHVESGSFSQWHERQVLSNKNRLLFALQRFVGAQFRADFLAAEQAYFASSASFDELRAINTAYLRALLDIDRALSCSISLKPVKTFPRQEVSELLSQLRDTCFNELLAKMRKRAEES